MDAGRQCRPHHQIEPAAQPPLADGAGIELPGIAGRTPYPFGAGRVYLLPFAQSLARLVHVGSIERGPPGPQQGGTDLDDERQLSMVAHAGKLQCSSGPSGAQPDTRGSCSGFHSSEPQARQAIFTRGPSCKHRNRRLLEEWRAAHWHRCRSQMWEAWFSVVKTRWHRRAQPSWCRTTAPRGGEARAGA